MIPCIKYNTVSNSQSERYESSQSSIAFSYFLEAENGLYYNNLVTKMEYSFMSALLSINTNSIRKAFESFESLMAAKMTSSTADLALMFLAILPALKIAQEAEAATEFRREKKDLQLKFTVNQKDV